MGDSKLELVCDGSHPGVVLSFEHLFWASQVQITCSRSTQRVIITSQVFVFLRTQTHTAVVPMYLNWTGESEEKRSTVMLLHIYPAQGAGQSVCCPGCEALSGAPALQSPWAARSDHYPSDLTGEKRQKEKTNRKVKGQLWQRQSDSRSGRTTGVILI